MDRTIVDAGEPAAIGGLASRVRYMEALFFDDASMM